MLDKIFSVGNRKIIAMVLALAAILFGDKLGITMTDDMNDAIVQLVAVFTGGNVLSKFAFALLGKVAPKLPLPQLQEEPDSPVFNGEPLSGPNVADVHAYAQRIANDATREISNLHERCKGIEAHMAKQSTTINQLMGIINTQVIPAIKGQPPVGPVNNPGGRVPTPNELYNQG